jgi:hypothetical protein
MVADIYNTYSDRKPIMIGEVGSAENFTPDKGFENPAAQDKAKWISDMFNAMNTKYPRIKAFIWFNVDKETNWKIESSVAATKAFQAGVSDGRYLSCVVNSNTTPKPTSTPAPTITPTPKPSLTATPTATPTGTPVPVNCGVQTTHRWAQYNNVYKPIEQFTVKAGTSVEQGIYYKNNGSKADSYTVSVTGLPAAWFSTTIYGTDPVNAGDKRYGNVVIKPLKAGTYKFKVTITSKTNRAVSSPETYTLYVK